MGGGEDDEPWPDAPGFDFVRSQATLVYGRMVRGGEGPEAAKNAARPAARVERWSREHGVALEVIGEGVLRAGERAQGLAVGVVLARADADGGPVPVKLSPEDAKKQLAAVKPAVWAELDDGLGLGLAAESRDVADRVGAAGLCVPRVRSDDPARQARGHQAADESRTVSLTPAATKARVAKTRALDGAKLYLTARYD